MLLTIDFETYYAKDFSLRQQQMSLLQYIRDPRFKTHGCAVKVDEAPSEWVTGKDLPWVFGSFDWSTTDVVSHNMNFDNTILFEKFGHYARRRIDTLGLCRAVLSHDLSFELGDIAPILGLGTKGDDLALSMGLRDLPPHIEEKLGVYACTDADLAHGIYKLLWPHLPQDERDTMDLVIRMSTEGILRFDHTKAAEARKEVVDDRQHKLQVVGVTPTELRSRNKFADLLRSRGVEPPTKISPTTGKTTFAFSKQDPEFVKLRAHPDVADLVEAKISWASNNAITRIDRLVNITGMMPYTLPVLLNYCGAHTGRLSGGGKINMQNLNARGKGKALRHAITAPPGCVIVVRDLSGIELRMNMWFSGEHATLNLIRNGGDPYIQEAAGQFNVPAASIDKDTDEGAKMRQYGKVVQLGCGFQMGEDRFRAYCATGPLGMDPMYVSEYEARKTIATYRANHPNVQASWNFLGNEMVPEMARESCNIQHKCVTFRFEKVVFPNGFSLYYPGLSINDDGWYWGINGRFHRIYGGITQENIVQGLAGVVIKNQMVEIDKELGGNTMAAQLFMQERHARMAAEAITRDLVRTVNAKGAVVHQVHDEILAVCREKDADDVFNMMGEVMSRPISWAPELPLASEGGYAYRYEK